MNPFRKIRAYFTRRKFESEMAEEMRLHLEQRTREKIEQGLSLDAARHAARRQFGGEEQIKERVREQRGGLWLDHLWRDLRHSGRALRRAPLLSAVVLLSLGLGIGANTVIFSWINSLVFRPLPGVTDASRFTLVEPRSETGSYPGASWTEYRDLAAQLPSFDWLLAYKMQPLSFGEPGHEERVYAQLVSGNYFAALGLHPALGRLLGNEETAQSGAAPVVVISHGFWQSHFAGAPAVLGRPIRLNEQTLTIVGVAPVGFMGTTTGLSFDLWVPATMAPVLLNGSNELAARDQRGYSLMGRIRGGAAEARTELATAMRELARKYPASNAGIDAELLPFWRAPRGAARLLLAALATLQGFMLLVLLVVCANTANLLLARASTRRREMGVRLALGARPWHVLRLVLIESLLLGFGATVLGLLLAVWGTNAIRAVPLPGQFPFKFDTALDLGVLLFAASLGLVCAVVFGLAPAIQSARIDSQLALRSAADAPARRGLRHALVSIEVALALLFLVGAATFLRSFVEARTVDPGFKTEGVLLAGYDWSSGGSDRTRALALTGELLRRLRAHPAVENAAIASWVPLDFHAMPQAAFKIDGQSRSDSGLDRALTYSLSPGYFALMKIPVVAGRDFSDLTDTTHGLEAIVNEEFVRKYLAHTPPLGHRIGTNRAYEIVGVVRNATYETFGEPAKPIVYFCLRDRFALPGQIHVRMRGAEAAFAGELRRIVRETSPAVSVYDVWTLSEHVDKNLFFRRIPARFFAVLAPLILALAAIGIYAVVAYAVAQRTAEIGLRIALGASTRRVVYEMVRDSMRAVGAGLIPAWLLLLVVTLHLRAGVISAPIVFGLPVLLLAVAWVAAWVPARRAAKIEPMRALRYE